MKLVAGLLALATLPGVSAFRARQRSAGRYKKQASESSFIFRRRRTWCPDPKPGKNGIWEWGSPGTVDYLYTFAAPGPTSPAVQHQTNEDGIFPGMRTWTRNGLGAVDIVPSITSTVFLWHPVMDAQSICKGREAVLYNATEQRNDTMRLPTQLTQSILLHMPWEYWDVEEVRARKWGCQAWYNYSMFSLNISYVPQLGFAARLAGTYGWNLVGSAYYDGTGGVIGGPQVSHLMQNPDTLECVLTFQGTQNYADWFANVAIQPTSFCGLTDEDEECGIFKTDACKSRRPRGAFAHWGFADTIRRMTRVPDFQNKIHANLGKCNGVYVTGHSLGGAIATLFSACVSRQLQPGDYGYEEDYKYMGWTKAWRPERLPPI